MQITAAVVQELHVDFNEAVGHLLEALSEIVEGCNTIRIGTGEIAQASDDLSRRPSGRPNPLPALRQRWSSSPPR